MDAEMSVVRWRVAVPGLVEGLAKGWEMNCLTRLRLTTSTFTRGVDSKRRAVLVTVFSCLDRIFSHGLIGLDH